jgi:mono/diheme cytochrome c family protein
MALIIVSWVLILAVSGVLVWLAIRTWRSRKKLLKWIGGIFISLITLILALITIVSAIGLSKLYIVNADPVPNLKVEVSQAQIARGEHLASVYCIDCHSLNGQLPLTGGKDMAADSPVPIGSLVSFNLTPAGPLKDWTDGEIFRTLRQGVDKDGAPLIIMSSASIRQASDEDLQAIIAFLRSQPAIPTKSIDGDNPNILLSIFVGAGLVSLPPKIEGSIQVPPKGVTADYGKYVVSFMGCSDCHGANLQGGNKAGLTPVGPNLMVVKGWSQDQFIATLRNGVDPTGHRLSDQMPWKTIGRLDDIEIGAIYQYLHNPGGNVSQ